MILAFHYVFALSLNELVPTNIVTHTVELKDDIPVYKTKFKLPHAHEAIMQDKINELLDAQIIRPSSSPCMLVLSPTKPPRLIIDYRAFDDKTKGDR